MATFKTRRCNMDSFRNGVSDNPKIMVVTTEYGRAIKTCTVPPPDAFHNRITGDSIITGKLHRLDIDDKTSRTLRVTIDEPTTLMCFICSETDTVPFSKTHKWTEQTEFVFELTNQQTYWTLFIVKSGKTDKPLLLSVLEKNIPWKTESWDISVIVNEKETLPVFHTTRNKVKVIQWQNSFTGEPLIWMTSCVVNDVPCSSDKFRTFSLVNETGTDTQWKSFAVRFMNPEDQLHMYVTGVSPTPWNPMEKKLVNVQLMIKKNHLKNKCDHCEKIGFTIPQTCSRDGKETRVCKKCVHKMGKTCKFCQKEVMDDLPTNKKVKFTIDVTTDEFDYFLIGFVCACVPVYN
ncbi:hypothetical protein [Salmon gill poxvirus]